MMVLLEVSFVLVLIALILKTNIFNVIDNHWFFPLIFIVLFHMMALLKVRFALEFVIGNLKLIFYVINIYWFTLLIFIALFYMMMLLKVSFMHTFIVSNVKLFLLMLLMFIDLLQTKTEAGDSAWNPT